MIEAKAAGTTLSGVAELTRGYQPQAQQALAHWGNPLRFDHEAASTEILCSDRVDPLHRSRRVFGFHRPATLHEWLQSNSSLQARLRDMPALIRRTT